jgi:phage terminase large subunit-like protein
MVLDNGDFWEPEDFQLLAIEDIFAGAVETWLVIPEGNAKTTLTSGFGLYHADYTPDAAVAMGAASRDQCEILHNQAAGFVRRTPGLEKRFRVYDGYRRIKALRTGGRMQVFAADDRTGDGVIPTLALLEELHRQRNLRLYRTWRGKLEKRGGQLVAISTAGEVGSEFEDTRRRIRTESPDVTTEGAYTRAAGGGLVLHDYAVPQGADVNDMKVVKMANPLRAIDTDVLQRKHDSPSMTEMHWRRFVCNQAVQTQHAVISEKEWGVLEDSAAGIPDGTSNVVIPIDLGWRHDTTAMVPMVLEDDQVVLDESKIIVPPRDGTATDRRVIYAVLRAFDERWNRITAVLDPEADGEQLAQWIDDELGWRVITHSQKNTPMALAAQRLLEVIAGGRLRRPHDPDLTRQVLAAAGKPVGEGLKLVKPKTGECIDGAVALAMGVSVLIGPKEAPRPMIEVLQ